jgi:hypothetical protein
MNKQIYVDGDVFLRLESEAKPFVDTPNSVLRRLLGLPEAGQTTTGHDPALGRRTGSRASSRAILPEAEYELPLLQSLIEAGGACPTKDAITAVGRKLTDKLTPQDKALLKSGVIRWENRVQFVRLNLVRRKLMAEDAPWGTWKISEQGRKFVADRGAGPSFTR